MAEIVNKRSDVEDLFEDDSDIEEELRELELDEVEHTVSRTILLAEYRTDGITLDVEPVINVSSVTTTTTSGAAQNVLQTSSKDKDNSSKLGKIKLRKSEDQLDPGDILKKSLASLMHDRNYFIGPKDQTMYRKVTLKSFEELIRTSIITSNIQKIIKILYTVLKISETKVFVSDAKRTVWVKFYKEYSTKIFQEQWNTIYNYLLIVDGKDIITYKLCMFMMQELISMNLEVNTALAVVNTKLLLKEGNVVRYVAGYVPHALIKFYKHFPKNKTALAFVEVLESMASVADKDSKKQHYFILKFG